ncbi:oleosin-B6-like isoform X1 [Astatotilapia calliptera]|uniref:oleosin-B6-like isoform X1 n=1 Tax=Astatotilapia calliptera TaxID=8154 RepID=UPI000E41F28D|nr:oleosin-B6-like isoform X1 [Astatotilapia calliptera]
MRPLPSRIMVPFGHKMSKRPKLSGGQGRKKREEEEEKREKDRDALLKFLNPTPGPSTTSTAAASTSAAQPTSDAASAAPAAQPSHDAAASSGLPAAPIDPADWPSALTEKGYRHSRSQADQEPPSE